MKKKNQIPNKGEIIEITDRRCSDNIQPTIKPLNRYRVLGTDKTKKGKDVIIVASKEALDKSHRINSDRFSWRILSPDEIQILKQRANEYGEGFIHKDKFSNHEMAMLVYHPTMIELLMWEFAELARQEAAYHRLAHLKQLSRTLTEIHNEDLRNMRMAMSKYGNLFNNLMECYKDWHNRIYPDIVKLFYSVNNVVKKYCPDYPYDTIRTNAQCSKLMLSVLVMHHEKTDDMVKKKNFMYRMQPLNEGLSKVSDILDAYIGDNGLIDPNDVILQNNCNVFYNRIIAEPLPFDRLEI